MFWPVCRRGQALNWNVHAFGWPRFDSDRIEHWFWHWNQGCSMFALSLNHCLQALHTNQNLSVRDCTIPGGISKRGWNERVVDHFECWNNGTIHHGREYFVTLDIIRLFILRIFFLVDPGGQAKVQFNPVAPTTTRTLTTKKGSFMSESLDSLLIAKSPERGNAVVPDSWLLDSTKIERVNGNSWYAPRTNWSEYNGHEATCRARSASVLPSTQASNKRTHATPNSTGSQQQQQHSNQRHCLIKLLLYPPNQASSASLSPKK